MNQQAQLSLAFHHVVRCASTGKACGALLDELRRLYTAASEPLPPPLSHLDGGGAGGGGHTLYNLFDDDYTIVPSADLQRDPF